MPSLNFNGPIGQPGPQGKLGPTGQTGLGHMGSTGFSGPTGSTGSTGPTGPTGSMNKIFGYNAQTENLTSLQRTGGTDPNSNLTFSFIETAFGATSIMTLPSWGVTGKTGSSTDRFGWSVALNGNGNIGLIGAYLDDGKASDAGAAYIFTRAGTGWSQLQKLLASDGETGDQFGISVALSGDGKVALIGANGDDNAKGSDAGAAYIFTQCDTGWKEVQKLTASDGRTSDQFGISVALSGDGQVALIGANFDDDVAIDEGAAYIFTFCGTGWKEAQKLVASDGTANDQFGGSVALSDDGQVALIGAFRDDAERGAAYSFCGTVGSTPAQCFDFLYAGTGATAMEPGTGMYLLNAKNVEEATEIYIDSYDINGDPIYDVILGIIFNTHPSAIKGHLSLSCADDPTEKVMYAIFSGMALPTGFTDYFKLEILYVSGDTGCVFGGPSGCTATIVCFARTGDNGDTGPRWKEAQKLVALDGTAGDFFGISVALSGDGQVALIGSNFDDDVALDAGAAYIFTQCETGWKESQKLTASDGTASDQFGISVALNSDGQVALIGAFTNDNVKGGDAGAAYLFTNSNDTWIEKAKILAFDGAGSDRFGQSVALNDDGGIGSVGTQITGAVGKAYCLDLYAPGTLSDGTASNILKFIGVDSYELPYYLDTFSETTLIDSSGKTGDFIKFSSRGQVACLLWNQYDQCWMINNTTADIENPLELD